MEEKQIIYKKWYDSEVGTGLKVGLAIFGFIAGYGVFYSLSTKADTEKIRAERIPEIQQRDLNGNGEPETYIVINGVKYFSAIDGKNLEKTLK